MKIEKHYVTFSSGTQIPVGEAGVLALGSNGTVFSVDRAFGVGQGLSYGDRLELARYMLDAWQAYGDKAAAELVSIRPLTSEELGAFIDKHGGEEAMAEEFNLFVCGCCGAQRRPTEKVEVEVTTIRTSPASKSATVRLCDLCNTPDGIRAVKWPDALSSGIIRTINAAANKVLSTQEYGHGGVLS